MFQAYKATSSSDTHAIPVWFRAVLGEVAEGLTELAEVLLRSDMPC